MKDSPMIMKLTLSPIIFLISLFLAFVSCQHDTTEETQPLIENEMILSGLNDENWTYFSFETGEMIGTSRFLCKEEDVQWSERTDWDFAICGKYLRTNGAASGRGMGGVLRDETHHFLSLEEAPTEGYLNDKIQIVR